MLETRITVQILYEFYTRFEKNHFTSTQGRLGEILETKNVQDPFILSKALLMKDLLSSYMFEIWQLGM